ncbi:LPXTG cell wall anchor domain-containing protein [Ectobacillus panaciterrae]|uniref:LPXTG cell wall anchor domain-containing protein n=1 Tax=Ectobacillus panaciterrae TaxID=363872 RepID=UPI000403B24B|nr:LPXTG cell wall anchor domain-containing protein [Ectobacillus panaciterrae]
MLKKAIALCTVTNLMIGGTIVSAQESKLNQARVSNEETSSKQGQIGETAPDNKRNVNDTSASDVQNNTKAQWEKADSNINQPANDNLENNSSVAGDQAAAQQQTTHREAAQSQNSGKNRDEVSQLQSTNIKNGQQQHAERNGDVTADKQNKVEQGQAAETKTNQSQTAQGGSDVQQNQWTSNYSDILQSAQINKNAAEQKQTANLQAAQVQSALSNAEAVLNQEQDVAAHLAQIQRFISGKTEIEQNQDTNVATEQMQYAHAGSESKAEIIQGQQTNVSSNQNSSIADITKEQQTEVTNVQVQGVQTSGSAILGQNQQVDVAGTNTTTADRVHVESKNLVNIFKRTMQTFVQFVQEINVNGQVERFQNEYELGQEDITHSQEYTKTYDWGIAAIGNYISVGKLFDTSDVLAGMSSFISIIFSPKKPRQDNPGSGQEGNQPDAPGSGQEGNQPDAPGSGQEGNQPDAPGSGQEGNQPDAPGSGQAGSQPNAPGSGQAGSQQDNPGSNQGGNQPDSSGNNQGTLTKENQQVNKEVAKSPTNTANYALVSYSNSDKSVAEQKVENQLPDTATNTFNNLLIGLCLLAISGCLYVAIRKKTIKE